MGTSFLYKAIDSVYTVVYTEKGSYIFPENHFKMKVFTIEKRIL